MTLVALVAAMSTFFFSPKTSSAMNKTSDWLDVQRDANRTQFEVLADSAEDFQDDVASSVARSQDLRMMLDGMDNEPLAPVDQLESSEQVLATDWLKGLPKASSKGSLLQAKAQCQYQENSGLVECASLPAKEFTHVELAMFQPQIMIVAPGQPLESSQRNKSKAPIEAVLPSVSQDDAKISMNESDESIKAADVKLFRGASGVVTVEKGKILIDRLDSATRLMLAPEVRKGHVAMFIRDPAIITLDESKNTLTAKQLGTTELFVVSRDRISIIPVNVEISGVVSLAQTSKASSKRQTMVNGAAPDLSMPANLASLDTLDKAAAGLRSSYGAAAAHGPNSSSGPADLTTPADLTQMSESDVHNISFSHGKAKTAFNKMYLRLVDERSSWNQAQVFPVGGMRVRVIGTEFQTRSDGQGFVEIPDVPAGARLLAEVIDDTGTLMPSIIEMVVDGQSSIKASAQMVVLRRYLSMDYAARMAGVVQNMAKASFCGTAVDTTSRKAPTQGVRVGTDVSASGPYYFNDLGYLDTRMGATGQTGRFCFFNIEPGPISIGFTRAGDVESTVSSSAVVVLTASGRHTEEFIALEDARHITTTVASVPTAGEQLSSDVERSNKYLAVDYAEVVPIGYSDAMVPIDDGVYTSATPLVPVRGRVWTVANSSDYEASVQASSVRLPGSRQITSLLPRGFVDDMMNYAQATHDYDQGVVVIEHAPIAGQGTDAVKIRLVDTNGKDAGDGWYFSDKPIAKAVFFNVPAGVYSILVETSGGHWIAADTAVTYPETSTYVRTGAPLEKHLMQSSAQN